MALEHILLGLLRTPASGYDIKRSFDETVGHFWAAELSQVYPALKRLERDGLLTSTTAPSDRGPPRTVYTITAAGRDRLRSWLSQPPRFGTERIEWLAQTWFLDELGDAERALSFMMSLSGEIARELAALEAIELHWKATDPRYPDSLPDEDFYPQLTLALGIRKLRAKLEWADECIDRIEARLDSVVPAGGG